MIEKLEDYLIGIALGVRFRANFSIEDQFGKIADTILYSDGAFFEPNVFPRATSSASSRILFNEVTNDRLHIDNSNIILEINFGDDLKFKKGDLETILEHFDKQIIKGVMREFSIKEIKRIGYIRRYLFEIEKLANSFVNKTVGSTLGGVNDINLKFSKRFPVQEALVKKDVNDFDNAIFTVIKKADLKEIFMAVDYQSFFDPYLPASNQIKFEPFIKKANGFNSKNYQIWLNDNYVEGNNE
jgi:hypothetical protein